MNRSCLGRGSIVRDFSGLLLSLVVFRSGGASLLSLGRGSFPFAFGVGLGFGFRCSSFASGIIVVARVCTDYSTRSI